jgi:hypothetical protein
MPYPPPPPAEATKTTAPIAFVQRLRNRASCLCCARCGSFAGSDAMIQCAAPSIPRDGASLADALKELNIKHRSHGVVFCGCGAVFCSEACLDDDEAHALHCCGPRAEGDPVVAFRASICGLPYADEVLLTVAVACAALDDSESEAAAWVDFALSAFDASSEDVPWAKLIEGVPSLESLGVEGLKRVYGRVREEALSITRESPLVARCRACTDAKDQAILVEFARQDDYDEDESDAPPEDTSRAALAVAAAFADESSSEEEDAQEESFASVAADADARFEPLEVLVLTDARPHACAPTYTLSASSKSGPLTLLEKRVAPGPATLSRVDTVLEREDRLEWLKLKGLDCDCARCRFEKGDSVSSTLLRAVAACAERDGRFEDALRAHGAILAEDPSDGDALYGRARVHGWSDKWGVERRLLEEAITLAPDHPDIRKAVATRDAYHCGNCSSRTFAFETVSRGGVSVWSSNSVVSSEACAKAIELAEAHASSTDGWTTARHFAVPTTDLPVHSSPDLLKWFNVSLKDAIFPAVAQVTGAASEKLRVIDAFVVRYDASRQKALPLHSDQSEYSITLPLNDRNEYCGGGTFFAALDEAVNCDAGGLVVFPGALYHAGAPTTKGRRYVIVAFLFEDRAADELERRLDGADRKLDGGAGYGDEEDDLSRLLANMNDQ